MNEDKAVRYRRQRGRFDVAAGACAALVLACLATTASAVWLREGVSRALGMPLDSQSLMVRWAFGALIILLVDVATLAVRHRRDVTLEARYRGGAPSSDRWLVERLTTAPVVAAGIGLVVAVAYALMDAWPTTWWAWAGLAWVVLGAAVTLWAPALAAPLVWPSVPLAHRELSERLQAVARRAGLESLEIHEWRLDPDEKRANALLVGVGPRRRVLLSSALLADYSEDEIEVIVAHELGHVVYRHLWWDLAVDTTIKLLALGGAHATLRWTWAWLGLTGPSDVAGLPAVLLAAGAVTLVLAPLPRALSRLEERQADRYALQLTHRPDAFVSALKRLGAHHLADTRRPMLGARLYNSHPPLQARLDFARRWSGERTSSMALR